MATFYAVNWGWPNMKTTCRQGKKKVWLQSAVDVDVTNMETPLNSPDPPRVQTRTWLKSHSVATNVSYSCRIWTWRVFLACFLEQPVVVAQVPSTTTKSGCSGLYWIAQWEHAISTCTETFSSSLSGSELHSLLTWITGECNFWDTAAEGPSPYGRIWRSRFTTGLTVDSCFGKDKRHHTVTLHLLQKEQKRQHTSGVYLHLPFSISFMKSQWNTPKWGWTCKCGCT